MNNPKIQLNNVHKDFISQNETLRVLKNVNLYVSDGEFVSVLGPSGCGKSTIFHILTGLETKYEGLIKIDDIPLE